MKDINKIAQYKHTYLMINNLEVLKLVFTDEFNEAAGENYHHYHNTKGFEILTENKNALLLLDLMAELNKEGYHMGKCDLKQLIKTKMATYKNGINGAISGKVGSVIGASCGGIDYLRILGDYSTRTFSEKQKKTAFFIGHAEQLAITFKRDYRNWLSVICNRQNAHEPMGILSHETCSIR